MFLAFTYQAGHIGYVLFNRADIFYQFGIHFIYHMAFVILHINNHGVQLCPVHQIDQAVHIGGSGHSPGNIDSLYLYPFSVQRIRYGPACSFLCAVTPAGFFRSVPRNRIYLRFVTRNRIFLRPVP